MRKCEIAEFAKIAGTARMRICETIYNMVRFRTRFRVHFGLSPGQNNYCWEAEGELMNSRELRIWNKAALTAFEAVLRTWDGKSNKADIAAVSYELADEFFWGRYSRILEKYPADKALRRIMRMDGYSGAGLDFYIKYYIDKPCPLRAYADSAAGNVKTCGQIAVTRYFEKQQPEKKDRE